MSDIRKLDIVKAKPVDEQIREEVVALLERYLEEAKRGDVSEIFILAQHTDATWTDRSSSVLELDKWIGRMERTKLEWIELARSQRKEEKR